jgi:carboxypeptidase family protein
MSSMSSRIALVGLVYLSSSSLSRVLAQPPPGRKLDLEPASIVGRVLDHDRPVVGVRVRARGAVRTSETTTDAQGRFTLRGLEEGLYDLGASTDDLVAQRLVMAKGTLPDVHLRLEPGSEIWGVVSNEIGAPIPRARVTINEVDTHVGPRWSGLLFVPRPGPLAIEADARGVYRTALIPRRRYEVRTSSTGYVKPTSIVRDLNSRQDRVDFTLATGTTISGVVLDPVGHRIQNAWVAAFSEEKTKAVRDYLCRAPPPLAESRSDEKGRFVLRDLPVGRIRIFASHLDYAIPDPIVVDAPGPDRHIVLGHGTEIRGIVVDENETPRRGTVVSVLGQDGTQFNDESIADAHGRFAVHNVTNGQYVVVVDFDQLGFHSSCGRLDHDRNADTNTGSAHDREGAAKALRASLFKQAPKELRPNVIVRGLTPSFVKLVVSSTKSISGMIRSTDGRAVANATIEAVPLTPDATRDHWLRLGLTARFERNGRRWGRSGPDGTFTLFNLESASYDLMVTADSFRVASLHTKTGASGVKVLLTPTPRIRGRVINEDGAPVTSCKIDHKQVTDANGAFDVPFGRCRRASDSAPCVRRLVFESDGYLVENPDIAMPDGDVLLLPEIILKRPKILRGRVIDESTLDGIENAELRVVEPVQRHWPDHVPSDISGGFELAYLAPGTIRVRVEHPNYAPSELGTGADERGLIIRMNRGATVTGEIRSTRGEPIKGAQIWAIGETWACATNSSDAGRFELKLLPLGAYRIVAEEGRSLGASPVCKSAPSALPWLRKQRHLAAADHVDARLERVTKLVLTSSISAERRSP